MIELIAAIMIALLAVDLLRLSYKCGRLKRELDLQKTWYNQSIKNALHNHWIKEQEMYEDGWNEGWGANH